MPPLTPEALLARGLALHRSGQLGEAVKLYQQALRQQPDLHAATHHQGLALFQLGLKAPGLSLLQRAAAALAEDAAAQHNLGRALLDLGRRSEALPHLERAADLAPASAAERVTLAQLLDQASERPRAIAQLQKAVSAYPEDAASHDLLSTLLYLESRMEEAVAAHQHAVRLKPEIARQRRIGYADPDPSRTLRTVPLPLEAARDPALASREALDAFAAARSLVMIDDVLSDPAAHRDWALGLDYLPVAYAGQNFPGIQTLGQDPTEVMRIIATALQRRVKWASPDTGVLRISFADSDARTDIHVDNEEGEHWQAYAAVLYLNPPEQAQGGTLFWRHRQSGWERRPPDAEVRAAGYPNFKAFQEHWLPNQTLTPFNQLAEGRDDWEPMVEVPMRSNRLVLYHGHFFHSLSNVFGNTKENGRMVQLFFFEAA